MKRSVAALAIFLAVSITSYGQATPTASSSVPRYNPGPSLPVIDGNLQYGLTGSEIFQLGLNGGSDVTATTNLSGDVEYLSTSVVHPFSMLYAGGVQFSTLAGHQANFFQSLSLSQGFVGHGWAAGVTDSISYLPESPTTGLSGIPGVGDLGLQPLPDPSIPAQSVLTNYANRISNTVGANIQRQLTGRTSLSGSGSYGILRFVGADSTGLDSTQIGAGAGINRLLDRRSSVNVNAQYSSYSYSSNTTSFNSRGVNLGYQRQLTKTIGLEASAGPQWISGFEAEPVSGSVHQFFPGSAKPFFIVMPRATTTTIVTVPSHLTVAASVSLSYARKFATFSLSYNHGVNNGSGVQTGAISDTVGASAQRTFGQGWATSISAAYARTSGLVDSNISSGVYGGIQVNRRLTRTLSGFASYTGIHQSVNATLASQNAFNGFSQVFSLGITFAPRMTRLGQF